MKGEVIMNKKEYIKADIEIIWFDTEDIITTSGEQEGQEQEYSEDL